MLSSLQAGQTNRQHNLLLNTAPQNTNQWVNTYRMTSPPSSKRMYTQINKLFDIVPDNLTRNRPLTNNDRSVKKLDARTVVDLKSPHKRMEYFDPNTIKIVPYSPKRDTRQLDMKNSQITFL